MQKSHVNLTKTDEQTLAELIKKGELPARIYKRATALIALNEGKTYQEVAQILKVNHTTVSIWAKRYKELGLKGLYDAPRSGRPQKYDGVARAKVTALASSTPPEGYERWTLNLLADKAVELEYVEEISKTQVHDILKKTS